MTSFFVSWASTAMVISLVFCVGFVTVFPNTKEQHC